jgi:mannose-6-phosphate isomerase-like protein (cupin superfamily)
MHPDQMLVVPPNTPHGFRNIGDVPPLTVSIHESGELDQTFLEVIRPDARRGSRG